jgi:hypothetical protein
MSEQLFFCHGLSPIQSGKNVIYYVDSYYYIFPSFIYFIFFSLIEIAIEKINGYI